jgi:fluoride ion exporter CrcB/FEX
MGVALWLGSGLAAWILARIIPRGRPRRPWGELAAAIVTALILGTVATALDFGGWNEADWRAGVFVLVGAFAGIGALRAFRQRN